ncbi:MAG: PAS domain-containing protein [Dehalococcoidaceae bacterium]|nr:PAS domain-containing protein [Dehalococcoidaceae bacterium]
MNIACLDAVSSVAGLFALILLIRGWGNNLARDSRIVLGGLLLVYTCFTLCLFLKWSGINTGLVIFEDSVGILLPLWWAFLFYALASETISKASGKREAALKQEIAERQAAEERVRHSNLELVTITDNFNGALLMETADRKIEFANAAFCRMFSIPAAPEQLIGGDCRAAAEQSKSLFRDPQAFANRVETIVNSGEKVQFELLEMADGRCIERDYVPVYYDNKLLYHLWIYRDVTHRVKTDKAIENAAREWRTTFDSISDMIAIVDNEFRLLRVNKAFAARLSKAPKELINTLCYQTVHDCPVPGQDCPYTQASQTGKPATIEFYEPAVGISIEATASPIYTENGQQAGAVLVIRDITERKMLQQKLVLQDRLASIGEMVSGVAHELNNPLTSVIGFSDLLLQRDFPLDVIEELQHVNKEARRSASIVKNLLAFSRQHPQEKTAVDVNHIISQVLELRAHAARQKNIVISTELAEGLPPLMGDVGQLQQVFLNIILNAEQSMSATRNRGTLTIETNRKESQVLISITDDGEGIPEEFMDRILNPFFTTRDIGKGTGLGLSICHGIITEHQGKISVQSKPGKGTTVLIELPSIE